MKRLLQVCWIMAAIILLVACGGGSAPDSADSPTGGNTSSTAASAAGSAASTAATSVSGEGSMAGSVAASSTGQVDEVVGSLTRSGGITGDTQTLIVRGDGAIQILNGDLTGQVLKMAQAPQAQVDDLRAAFASNEWQSLEAKYGQQVPDGFAYTVISGNKQVVTYDGVQNPHGLDVVLAQLSGLWQVAQTAP